ncbi:MAG: hypothetical protein J6S67_20100 [Methanobrevibacter sp.]|nr:hypothetical protein [Methanobrevibacter sp.]
MTNYYIPASFEIPNNCMIIKPDLRLLGDQTQNTVVVDANHLVKAYKVGKYANGEFVEKPLKVFANVEWGVNPETYFDAAYIFVVNPDMPASAWQTSTHTGYKKLKNGTNEWVLYSPNTGNIYVKTDAIIAINSSFTREGLKYASRVTIDDAQYYEYEVGVEYVASNINTILYPSTPLDDWLLNNNNCILPISYWHSSVWPEGTHYAFQMVEDKGHGDSQEVWHKDNWNYEAKDANGIIPHNKYGTDLLWDTKNGYIYIANKPEYIPPSGDINLDPTPILTSLQLLGYPQSYRQLKYNASFDDGTGMWVPGYWDFDDVWTINQYSEIIKDLFDEVNLFRYRAWPPLPIYKTQKKTWLSFNEYSNDGLNDYGYTVTYDGWYSRPIDAYSIEGDNWNGMNSAWAYLNGIESENADRIMDFWVYECPDGTYLNVFNLLGETQDTITDTEGNTLSGSKAIFDAYCGSVINSEFPEYLVSNNRHAYPDNGHMGLYVIELQPEKTKFIQYTNATTDTLDVVLSQDRYELPHENTYFNRDTTLYNTVIGTVSSTNEESIPDATWRKYYGVYLGESIPYLGIEEEQIPPSEILGVPSYDKQINTSDTLKYGTVASASTTFVLNMPVDEAMNYNSDLLILFYDFTQTNTWTRLGFFYVDSVEAIDEYTSRLTAHDETYKLNKYVDDFLKAFYEPITLQDFMLELLDYCECDYDSQMATFNNGDLVLDNIYDAVKTTGTEVAHYVASMVPAFVHANIDGDILIDQYHDSHVSIGISDYTELRYVAYNSDVVNRVKITSSNNVIAEDTHGTGENYYYLADNPLINTSWPENTLTDIANVIEMAYRNLPKYRPATIKFLVLPSGIKIGDYFNITTPTNQTYCVYIMSVKIDASGIEIESMGTQQFPVESSGNSQFINVLNDLGSISADISGIDTTIADTTSEVNRLAATVSAMALSLSNTTSTVSTLNTTVASLSTRMGTAEGDITTTASTVSSLVGTVSAMTVTTASNLTTVSMNGNTASELVNKSYIDSLYADTMVVKVGDVQWYHGTRVPEFSTDILYFGKPNNTTALLTPIYATIAGTSPYYAMWKIDHGHLYGLFSIYSSNTGVVSNYWEDLGNDYVLRFI